MQTTRNISYIAVFTLLLVLLAGPPLPSVASQHLDEPQQIVQDISVRLKEILRNDRQRLKDDPEYVQSLAREILLPYVDFDKVSSLVLGKTWRRATDEQREQFSYQFQRLLVRTYSTAFHEMNDDWDIRFLPLRKNDTGDKVVVRIQVLRASGGQPLDVLYRMHLQDSHWKAYDVQIEGISLVTSYRSTFAKEVRNGGIKGLIERITELNDSRVRPSA
jgi:phospholipid transport system substrate-binding protein